MEIHSEYHGADGLWHIFMDGEQVHATKEIYQRDMFIAELKAKFANKQDIECLLQRLKIAQKALEGVIDVIHVQGENREIGEQSQWDEALLFKVREALDQLKE